MFLFFMVIDFNDILCIDAKINQNVAFGIKFLHYASRKTLSGKYSFVFGQPLLEFFVPSSILLCPAAWRRRGLTKPTTKVQLFLSPLNFRAVTPPLLPPRSSSEAKPPVTCRHTLKYRTLFCFFCCPNCFVIV